MPQFKVFNLVPGTWEGKARLRVEGNLIDDDGARAVCAMTFYAREGHPLPTLNEGAVYHIKPRFYVSKGRLEMAVDALIPAAAKAA